MSQRVVAKSYRTNVSHSCIIYHLSILYLLIHISSISYFYLFSPSYPFIVSIRNDPLCLAESALFLQFHTSLHYPILTEKGLLSLSIEGYFHLSSISSILSILSIYLHLIYISSYTHFYLFSWSIPFIYIHQIWPSSLSCIHHFFSYLAYPSLSNFYQKRPSSLSCIYPFSSISLSSIFHQISYISSIYLFSYLSHTCIYSTLVSHFGQLCSTCPRLIFIAIISVFESFF